MSKVRFTQIREKDEGSRQINRVLIKQDVEKFSIKTEKSLRIRLIESNSK